MYKMAKGAKIAQLHLLGEYSRKKEQMKKKGFNLIARSTQIRTIVKAKLIKVSELTLESIFSWASLISSGI